MCLGIFADRVTDVTLEVRFSARNPGFSKERQNGFRCFVPILFGFGYVYDFKGRPFSKEFFVVHNELRSGTRVVRFVYAKANTQGTCGYLVANK